MDREVKKPRTPKKNTNRKLEEFGIKKVMKGELPPEPGERYPQLIKNKSQDWVSLLSSK